jgi:hypothetical protein
MAVVRRQEGVRRLSRTAAGGFSLAEPRRGLCRSSETISFGVVRVAHHASGPLSCRDSARRWRRRRFRCAPACPATSSSLLDRSWCSSVDAAWASSSSPGQSRKLGFDMRASPAPFRVPCGRECPSRTSPPYSFKLVVVAIGEHHLPLRCLGTAWARVCDSVDIGYQVTCPAISAHATAPWCESAFRGLRLPSGDACVRRLHG